MISAVVARSGSPAAMKGMNALFPAALRLSKVWEIREESVTVFFRRRYEQSKSKSLRLDIFSENAGQFVDIFVTTPGEADDNSFIFGSFAGRLDAMGDCVRAFECW